jgi:alkylhydroperoxidase family enzyme
MADAKVRIPEDQVPITALMSMGTPVLSAHNHTRAWSAVYAESTISSREREAWRQRLAHFEGCEHCATIREDSNLVTDKSTVSAEFYDNIFDHRWEGYSTRESLLIELIERFEEDHEELRDNDDFWARMHANFTETEIVDVSYHMIGPQLGRALMAKVLLGFAEFCEVRPPVTNP